RDRDWDNDGELDYAETLLSTPGQFDGLYWPQQEGVLPSPLEDYVASEQDYLSKRETGSPVHGYRARILTAQGAAAPGGAADYKVDGHLSKGWAVVAWPAEYGVTGVMTFLTSHHGIVYQR